MVIFQQTVISTLLLPTHQWFFFSAFGDLFSRSHTDLRFDLMDRGGQDGSWSCNWAHFLSPLKNLTPADLRSSFPAKYMSAVHPGITLQKSHGCFQPGWRKVKPASATETCPFYSCFLFLGGTLIEPGAKQRYCSLRTVLPAQWCCWCSPWKSKIIQREFCIYS